MSIALEDVSAGIGMLGGEIAALAAAALWALATVCFGRIGQFLSPLKMNLLKNVLGALMLAVTLAVGDNLAPAADRRVILIFLLSGAVGIGIGDSAYFGALQRLGARRSLLMLVLAPPLTAIASGFFLGERLSVAAWLAVGFTTAGVAWVISERTSSGGRLQHPSLSGIGLGLVAMLGQTAGAVLSHAAFLGSEMTAMQSALWRLAGGTGIVEQAVHAVFGFAVRVVDGRFLRQDPRSSEFYPCLPGTMRITTRRFLLRPSGVALVSAGFSEPNDEMESREASIPCAIR